MTVQCGPDHVQAVCADACSNSLGVTTPVASSAACSVGRAVARPECLLAHINFYGDALGPEHEFVIEPRGLSDRNVDPVD
jgi:hypothetical protein